LSKFVKRGIERINVATLTTSAIIFVVNSADLLITRRKREPKTGSHIMALRIG
jgi:hypothetical protein